MVIQTYSPEHYSIVAAAKQDYKEFYQQEIGYRSLMKYPPVWQMLVIFFSGRQEEEVRDLSQKAADILKRMEFLVIGPGEASLARMKDQYRRVIYIKDADYQNLIRAKDEIERWLEQQDEKRNILVNFDFNPMNSY